MVFLRSGRASTLFRFAAVLWTALAFSVAAFFPLIRGLGVLVLYFTVRGLADGFFWAARHRSFLWTVHNSGRDQFALKLQAITVSLSIVLPILGGFAITYVDRSLNLSGDANLASGILPAGYRPVFFIAGCVTLVGLLLSPRLRIGESPLSLRSIASLLKRREARAWCAYICLGGSVGAMLAVAAGIQTFGLLKTEFRVGALTASIALVSSVTFFVLGKLAARLSQMRLGGVLIGSLADFSSRCIYALAPTTVGLVVKSLLDALLVPLKNLLGENVIFELIERLGGGKNDVKTSTNDSANGVSPLEADQRAVSPPAVASSAELYVFREFFIEFARIAGCMVAGAVFLAISATGVEQAPQISARVLIGLSAPMTIVEYLFIRSFARDNARGRQATANAPASR
jgi:hypothetical protein